MGSDDIKLEVIPQEPKHQAVGHKHVKLPPVTKPLDRDKDIP